MKLKVCGMKLNTQEVAKLRPDYLGFIFWKPSKRYFSAAIPEIATDIKKVGVFVNASLEEVSEKIEKYGLEAVQLHGNESVAYCKDLKEKILSFRAESRNKKTVQIIKVFSIKDDFNFDELKPYEEVCDYFLFDTMGKLPGGNGYAFDWKVLKNYPSTKPYFLSGGIGLEEMDSIREFIKRPESKYCHAIDVNSRFEIEPGLKDEKELEKFKELLAEN